MNEFHKKLLNDLNLDYYDVYDIIKKTRGIIDGDSHWVDINMVIKKGSTH